MKSLRTYQGCSVVDDVFSVFKYRTKYPGERHGMVHNAETNRLEVANFLGPGTQLKARELSGDTKPLNDLDAAAKRHDYAYRDAQKSYDKSHDKKTFDATIWKADDDFINQSKSSKNDPKIGKLAAAAIYSKEKAEQVGVLPTSVFSGRGINELPSYIKLAIKQTKKRHI